MHPTSYFEKKSWNAPIDDAESRAMAETYIRGMASPFYKAESLWAPRYRQATFGAFLTDSPDSAKALDVALADVLEAFDYFVAQIPADQPIVLAGHSQGSYLLRRLVAERIKDTPLAKRLSAAYLIGWPVSAQHDLPMMGIPACEEADQKGCVVSWLSVAEPAETEMLLKAWAMRGGLDGQPIGQDTPLCSNPLLGKLGGSAEATANTGTLVPDNTLENGSLIPKMVPASCRPDGFLSIGAPPEMGPYVLPGNNYHVYDIPLFWAPLRDDFARRAR